MSAFSSIVTADDRDINVALLELSDDKMRFQAERVGKTKDGDKLLVHRHTHNCKTLCQKILNLRALVRGEPASIATTHFNTSKCPLDTLTSDRLDVLNADSVDTLLFEVGGNSSGDGMFVVAG